MTWGAVTVFLVLLKGGVPVIACNGGTYGENCGGQCGLCKDGEVCNAVTGHCSACQTNLLAPLCKVCETKWHGSSCDKECSALCGGDGSCAQNSSQCLQGCVTGYVLNGTSCESNPPNLFLFRPWEPGLAAGRAGTVKGGPDKEPDSGVATGGVISSILILMLLIALVLLFVSRRPRKEEEGEVRSRSAGGDVIDAKGKPSDNTLFFDHAQSTTEYEVKGRSQKPMVAVKATVQQQPAVNTNEDSGNDYHSSNSIDASESGSDQASNPKSDPPSNTLSSPPSNPPNSPPSNPHKTAVNNKNNSMNNYHSGNPIDTSESGGDQASTSISGPQSNQTSNPLESRLGHDLAGSSVSGTSITLGSPPRNPSSSCVDGYELEDVSNLAEDGHVSAHENYPAVYASLKKSKLRLDSVQRYLVDRLASGSLAEEFSEIKAAPDGAVYHFAELPVNSQKNRFQEILPYNKNRIVLHDGYDENGATDYINASYMPGYCSSKQFIAAQGPLPNTVGDFWRMVWEEQAEHVVMLTKTYENGSTKCEQYWPKEEGGWKTYGPVTVTITDIQRRDDFFVRTFRIKRDGSNQSREVTQYHYTAWPDQGDASIACFVRFYLYVIHGRTTSATTHPVIVHCRFSILRSILLLELVHF